MSFKLAIHDRKGSFSDRWIDYCQEQGLAYKLVNCHDTDIISQLTSVNVLLWHWVHFSSADVLSARAIIQAAEGMGLKVFPNSATCWHFDDKIAQKYLLESIGAPLVPTHIFYDSDTALTWIEQTSFPKVFKLSSGAGSTNVQLVRSMAQAHKLAKQAFGPGFKQKRGYFRDAKRKFKRVRQRRNLLGVLWRMPGAFIKARRDLSRLPREQGYLYFQDFMPNNQFDTRITVIGNRAFGFTRNVRPGDFRASGSGVVIYDRERINPKCVSIAFEVAKKLAGQSIAFDFVTDAAQQPWIVEVSYCYVPQAVYDCPGHWDDQLNWHEGNTWPQDAILMDLLDQLGFSQ